MTTNPYEGAGTFTVVPDASNVNDRRITAPGCRHVAKVYGWPTGAASDPDVRANWIAAALNAAAAGAVSPEIVAYERRRFTGDDGWIAVAPDDIPHYRAMGQEIRALGVISPLSATDVPDATRAATALIVARRVELAQSDSLYDTDDAYTALYGAISDGRMTAGPDRLRHWTLAGALVLEQLERARS